MTVKEAIEQLKKQPEDTQVFFDCPFCFRSAALNQVVKVERVEISSAFARKK